MSDSSEVIISGASTIVAGAALALSIYEARASRRHNKLSVSPRFDFALRVSPAFPRFALSVSNKGLGPGEVIAHDFLVDGEQRTVLQRRGVDTWEKLTAYLNFPNKMNWGFLQKGSLLKPGDEEELIGASYSVYDPMLAKAFRQSIRRLHITIHYASLYGDRSDCDFDGGIEVASEA